MSVIVSNLGFPRIGPRRELKTALEAYWAGKTDKAALLETAEGLRAATWARQKALGVEVIPSNDFSFYDQVLDTSIMVGAIPEIYRAIGEAESLDVYFAMARGTQARSGDDGCGHGHGRGGDVPALEMTKWFDTNYHYMVPELTADQPFQLTSTKVVDEYLEAKALGYDTRPVILGPVTWLLLAKSKQAVLEAAGAAAQSAAGLCRAAAPAARRGCRLGADRRARTGARSSTTAHAPPSPRPMRCWPTPCRK